MEIINLVVDEIIEIIDSLNNGKARTAYALYLDWCGDVKKLNKRDYSAACDLLWRGIEDAGFDTITCKNEFKRFAGFQLAW